MGVFIGALLSALITVIAFPGDFIIFYISFYIILHYYYGYYAKRQNDIHVHTYKNIRSASYSKNVYTDNKKVCAGPFRN